MARLLQKHEQYGGNLLLLCPVLRKNLKMEYKPHLFLRDQLTFVQWVYAFFCILEFYSDQIKRNNCFLCEASQEFYRNRHDYSRRYRGIFHVLLCLELYGLCQEFALAPEQKWYAGIHLGCHRDLLPLLKLALYLYFSRGNLLKYFL